MGKIHNLLNFDNWLIENQHQHCNPLSYIKLRASDQLFSTSEISPIPGAAFAQCSTLSIHSRVLLLLDRKWLSSQATAAELVSAITFYQGREDKERGWE